MKKFKLFYSYYRPYKKWMILDLGCAILFSMISISFPIIADFAINETLPNRDLRTFLMLMIGAGLAYFLNGFLIYIMGYVGHTTGAQIEGDIREDLFGHMQKLSTKFYDKNRIGNLMSRVTTDLFEMTELAHHGPEDALICFFTIVGSLIGMFVINWRLAICILVIIPIAILFIYWREQITIHCVDEMKDELGRIHNELETSISGIRITKAFANEKFEKERFKKANGKLRIAKKNYFKQVGIYSCGMDWIKNAMKLSVMVVGGILYLNGMATFANIISFNLFVMVLLTPIQKLIDFSEILIGGISGFSRFSELMTVIPEITDKEKTVVLKNPKGKINFSQVDFSYDSKTNILKNISLEVKPGECIAVIGSSGAGKTTLCHLLPRFYEVDRGGIKVDDLDIRDISMKSLRENIGLVQQDVFLFPDTIMENIRYGKLKARDEEVIEAAKNAEMHEEILQMKDGYHTFVGDRGAMLSGGQKQRISIARMFLKNPKIILLDEATSALDSVTEMKIQGAIDRLSLEKTMIVIAHRLSTIRSADMIVVLEGGRIIEKGTHEILMGLEGQYSYYYNAQYEKQEKEKEKNGKNE